MSLDEEKAAHISVPYGDGVDAEKNGQLRLSVTASSTTFQLPDDWQNGFVSMLADGVTTGVCAYVSHNPDAAVIVPVASASGGPNKSNGRLIPVNEERDFFLPSLQGMGASLQSHNYLHVISVSGTGSLWLSHSSP